MAMSFFRYPGGKSKIRNVIAERLAEQADHSGLQYREPFFGGGSIGLKLLADNPDIKKIWINDKDVGIACLWTAVIKYPEDLKECVRAFKPSVQNFYDLQDELSTSDKVWKQRKKLVTFGFKKLSIHQISYSGLGVKSGGPLGGADQDSDYKIDCRWSPDYICKKIDELHLKFKSIEVHNNSCTSIDFADLIKDTSCKSLLYLDPPYYVKGNELYQHGFTQQDHERLAAALKITPHAWVLSYDDCPEIVELYKWAYIKPLSVNYSITALKTEKTKKRESRTKVELLISPNRFEFEENPC